MDVYDVLAGQMEEVILLAKLVVTLQAALLIVNLVSFVAGGNK